MAKQIQQAKAQQVRGAVNQSTSPSESVHSIIGHEPSMINPQSSIIKHRSMSLRRRVLQVEESLAKQFQQAKAQQVRGALQAWLAPPGANQPAPPLPQGLRDAALEFTNCLVGSGWLLGGTTACWEGGAASFLGVLGRDAP